MGGFEPRPSTRDGASTLVLVLKSALSTFLQVLD